MVLFLLGRLCPNKNTKLSLPIYRKNFVRVLIPAQRPGRLERDVALLLADPLLVQANPHIYHLLFERAGKHALPESLFRLAERFVLFATCECTDAVNFHDFLFRDGAKPLVVKTSTHISRLMCAPAPTSASIVPRFGGDN